MTDPQAAALTLLREMQWSGDNRGRPCCPICKASFEDPPFDHRPDCRLARTVADLEAAARLSASAGEAGAGEVWLPAKTAPEGVVVRLRSISSRWWATGRLARSCADDEENGRFPPTSWELFHYNGDPYMRSFYGTGDMEWASIPEHSTPPGPASAGPGTGAPRWRHTKRGSTYAEVGRAELQASSPVGEMASLVVYRAEHDGKLWAREATEFEDGRFERLPDTPCLWAGGNDSIYCRTCGAEYEYGKEARPACPRAAPLTVSDAEVEAAARALCKAEGDDPDRITMHSATEHWRAWVNHIGFARAALIAALEIRGGGRG